METHPKNISSMTQALESFVEHLTVSRKSQETIQAYKRDLIEFLKFLSSKNVNRLTSIKAVHVVCYLNSTGSSKSSSSLNRYYMSIRAFNRFLRKIRGLSVDFVEGVPVPARENKLPRVPTVAEIDLILQQPNINTEPGLRDRAILELLYSSGLRASELGSLKLLDFQGVQVSISLGKRKKGRTVPVNGEAAQWVQRYIELRGHEPGYLFLTVQGKKVSRGLLADIVRQHAKNAGVEQVTPHTLRHACATHLLDAGADLRLIQEVLGHSTIASTEKYTHISSQRLQEKFNEFHPRKKQGNV